MISQPIDHPRPQVSVLMPTYGHASFITRAIHSLQAQSFIDWELIIIDDASPDGTSAVVRPLLAADLRLRYHRLEANVGPAAALNAGMREARGRLIAYLPSDDVYYADHLASLVQCLTEEPEVVAAYSGVRYNYNRQTDGQIPLDGYSLQMVQVMHRRTTDCWTERAELVSDDLERLFWAKLREPGSFAATGQVTCEWVAHPGQLHKLLREPIGGINPYRQRFAIRHPLRFHTTQGNFIDEVTHYRRFRERPDTPVAADGLKILLVGELAYNAERVLALEERGHKLYGLWMPNPYWYNTVGPLPFGHVEDLPADDWQAAIRRVRPDVIYALLNWQAVPFVRQVLDACPDIPFVWHFKEGPFICLEHGIWHDLVAIHQGADGQIFTSPEMRDWYAHAIPGVIGGRPVHILDGDLPKRDWFDGIERSQRLSEQDREVHTVVPGRPIGLHPHNVAELAGQGIHLHFYGDFTHGQWKAWIDKTRGMAPNHLHLHPNVDQSGWVREFSQYDAGWLHWQQSVNGGDIARSNWDDLNYPARIATLVAAGLPLLQFDNKGAQVATQTLARDHDIGVFFSSIPELAGKLRDGSRMAELRENVWEQRTLFTFDHHADQLIGFFREVIARK